MTGLRIVLPLLMISAPARAESLRDFLQAFHANPALMMRRLPPEVKASGETVDRGFIREPAGRRAVPQRKAQADVDPVALSAKIVEGGAVLANLAEIERRGLNKTDLADKPWADSYWPLYKGMTGRRYADPNFPDDRSWSANRDYVLAQPAPGIFADGDPARINALSPSEKYDLALGDAEMTLTRYAWAQGEKNLINGVVPSWMGICHGWAAAAHMGAAFPLKPVEVKAPNGVTILFYPQDVKALQSMLWANASVPTRFVGNRCNVANPPRSANGRVLDAKCFDVDPATWHLIAANQLGLNKRPFVMDSHYDLEVWNYMAVAYRTSFFNPQSWRESSSLRTAAIPLASYTLDKFPEFRSPRARYVVGVKNDVSHIAAVEPNPGTPSANPPLKTIRYVYDLELDENFDVVGGEWYSNGHPDFVWTYDPGRQALAPGEGKIADDPWTPREPVPPAWTELAARASARGEPLFAFIRRLRTEDTAAPVP